MLDIHDYNGQLALQGGRSVRRSSAAIIHEGGEATRVLDKDGTVLLDEPDDGTGGRPEVHRGELRQILLDSLPGGHGPVGAQGHRRSVRSATAGTS